MRVRRSALASPAAFVPVPILGAAVGLLGCCAAQGPTWTEFTGTGPSGPRAGAAMAFDSQRGRTVLFGGHDQTARGDTWEWDGSAWALASNTGPVPRYGHAMAYDSARGRTVLFGGGNGLLLADTWEWDGTRWTQVATTGPSPRGDHAMAFDSRRGRVVLFGGFGFGFRGDTWEWDGSSWTQVSSVGPLHRSQHAMAYDVQRGRTVLVGGSTSPVDLGSREIWEWDGAWTQAAALLQVGLFGHAMAYDAARGRTIVFGGFEVTSSAAGVVDHTQEWDGGTMRLVGTTGPAARHDHAMAYDGHRGQTVLFGGLDANRYLGDVWLWNGDLVAGATTFGAGCGNPALVLAPVANARPIIDSTAELQLTNIPSSLAFVSAGWSRTMWGDSPLPLSLAPYGMPGCDLLQSADHPALPAASVGAGAATFRLALPDSIGLVGVAIHLQGWAPAPGANPAGIIVSDGVEWVIGNQ